MRKELYFLALLPLLGGTIVACIYSHKCFNGEVYKGRYIIFVLIAVLGTFALGAAVVLLMNFIAARCDERSFFVENLQLIEILTVFYLANALIIPLFGLGHKYLIIEEEGSEN